MPPSPELDEFLRKLAPLLQSTKFPHDPESESVYQSLGFSCIAVRHGSEWVLVSGKAVLKIDPCPTEAGLKRVAASEDIVALKGRIPASEFNGLMANLRDSWVLKREKIRLTAGGVGGYSWRLSYLVSGFLRSSWWTREFALCGNGPDLSKLLDHSTLQQIDGLCAKLKLPFQRINLTSSFQVSAELPAILTEVWWARRKGRIGDLIIYFSSFGVPELRVEWLPQDKRERIPADFIEKNLDFKDQLELEEDIPGTYNFVSIQAEDGARAAKLILYFGELQAVVSRVDFLGCRDTRELDVVREEPGMIDLGPSKGASQ